MQNYSIVLAKPTGLPEEKLAMFVIHLRYE